MIGRHLDAVTPRVVELDLVDLYHDADPYSGRGPLGVRGAQAREHLVEAVVCEYLDALVDEVELPPIRVLRDATGAHRLWDGWHRLEAHRRRGRAQIRAIVEDGDERATVLAAVGANAEHGLRRSDADKRRAVTILLEDPEWRTWSDRAIADRCRVHHSFVGRVRRDLEAATGAGASPERRGRDGRLIDTTGVSGSNRARTTAEEVEAGLAAERDAADEVERRGTPVTGEDAEALLEDDTGTGDEDPGDRSSADAGVVTGGGVETAAPPSQVYVFDEHDPADLARGVKVAAHRFGGAIGEPARCDEDGYEIREPMAYGTRTIGEGSTIGEAAARALLAARP